MPAALYPSHHPCYRQFSRQKHKAPASDGQTPFECFWVTGTDMRYIIMSIRHGSGLSNGAKVGDFLVGEVYGIVMFFGGSEILRVSILDLLCCRMFMGKCRRFNSC